MKACRRGKLAGIERSPVWKLTGVKSYRGRNLVREEPLPEYKPCRSETLPGRNIAGMESLLGWKTCRVGGCDSQSDEKLKMGSKGYSDNLGWKNDLHGLSSSRQND